MRSLTSRFNFLLLPMLILFVSAYGQKKDLKPEDYGQWQRLTTTEVSPNGNWFAYNISLVDGDGWLMLKKVGSDSTGEFKFMHGIRPSFTEDNRWFAFQIGVSEKKEEQLEKQNEQVRYKLGLMNLETAEVDTFSHIQSFEFSETGHHLAMMKYQAEEVETGGTDLVLRDLEEGRNQLIGNVSDYEFNNDDGTLLAVAIDASEKLGNGIQLYNLNTNGIQILDSDTTEYKNLSWNEEGTSLAFLKAKSDPDYEEDTYQVFAFTGLNGSPDKQVFEPSGMEAFPEGYRVVDYRTPNWSEDNNSLFFGIKKWKKKDTKEAEQDTTESKQKNLDEDLEPTNVEIWHWKDDEIQPRQEVTANSLRRDNHLSAWHLDENSFVQLEDEKMEEVNLTGDQQHAVGYDPDPYEPTFEEEWRDIYIIDTHSGEREKILDRHEFVQSSPNGKYLLYFKDNEWWTYDIAQGKHTNITADIDSRFENFHNVNGREQRRPFGNGQWSEDDEWVLLYDEFDVYRVWPDGNDYEKLTDGTSGQVRYRQTRVTYEEDYLEDNQPVYLDMYGEYTKQHGYARLDRRDNLETLIFESKMISRLTKAESAEHYFYQVESATDSPDFFRVDDEFENAIALTRTNPQQEEYKWADDELITYTNDRGEKLQGRLLYPADYEEGTQYPMIVYIYERRSQTTHSYSLPSRTSPYNQRRYSSEGYFVFEPDITYELRDPGMSAVECIVPAVQKMIDSGMINRDQIGLTGHSWGAYQTTFVITQTDLFNSAVAGAPLTNMVSMYNSIYWNSGNTDAMIFEVSQGRFPDPWWQDWDNFIENSTIFNIQNTQTPLLVEFGTDDGAVDFNQGVELYNTMRRMEKPYVMLVYEGENHGLRREENRIDYATRAFQWHEHYLKGKEAPEWIIEGMPWLKRPEIEEEGN